MLSRKFIAIQGRFFAPQNACTEKCVFFDDSIKNVDSANEFGLKSYLFTDISDIESVL